MALAAAAVLVILLGLVVQDRLRWPSEPSYQGRSLSSWLAEPDDWSHARERAIIAMGTNAVPALVVHLQARDSMLGRMARSAERFLPRRLWVLAMQWTRPVEARDRRLLAARALGILGPVAEPAIPALARALGDPHPIVVEAAVESLRRIGPQSLPVLVTALRTTNDLTYGYVCTALSRFSPAATPALSELVRLLPDIPPHRREHLIQALASMGSPVVPALATLLQSSDPETRKVGVAALQNLTAGGYGAVKEVIALLKNPDPAIRAGAAQVLAGPTVWGRQAVAAIVGTLQDPDESVRLAAVEALASSSEWTDHVTNALPALRALALSDSPQVRASAVATQARIETLAPHAIE